MSLSAPNPGITEAFARACNWLTYVCLPLWLLPEQFGQFSFLLALVLLVSAIGTAGQDRFILRYVSLENPQQNTALVSIALLCAIGFSSLVFTIAYLVLHWTDMYAPYGNMFIWVLLWGIGQSLYLLLISLSRALNHNRNFLVLRGVYGLAKLLILLTVAATSGQIAHLVMTEALLLLAVLLYALFSFSGLFTLARDAVIWRKSLLFGLPLVLHIVAGATLGQIDKLMIGNMLNAASLGVYAFINSIAGGVFFIFAVINIVYEAKVYQMGVSDAAERLMRRMFLLSFSIACGILLVANLLMPLVLELFDKSDYYDGQTMLVLSLAYLIYPFYLQSNVRFALKEQTKFVPLMTGLAALVNVAMNLVLIPGIGIVGAAYSTLAAYIVLVLLAQYTSRRV